MCSELDHCQSSESLTEPPYITSILQANRTSTLAANRARTSILKPDRVLTEPQSILHGAYVRRPPTYLQCCWNPPNLQNSHAQIFDRSKRGINVRVGMPKIMRYWCESRNTWSNVYSLNTPHSIWTIEDSVEPVKRNTSSRQKGIYPHCVTMCHFISMEKNNWMCG